jgi:hypothetical protein
MQTQQRTFKFHPGILVATPAVLKKIKRSDYITAALVEHLQGHWGIVDPEDWDANDRALKEGGRLLSVYPCPDSEESFWILTEADRSVTTILLPSDY